MVKIMKLRNGKEIYPFNRINYRIDAYKIKKDNRKYKLRSGLNINRFGVNRRLYMRLRNGRVLM
jgi:hypothetical protein